MNESEENRQKRFEELLSKVDVKESDEVIQERHKFFQENVKKQLQHTNKRLDFFYYLAILLIAIELGTRALIWLSENN